MGFEYMIVPVLGNKALNNAEPSQPACLSAQTLPGVRNVTGVHGTVVKT